MDAQPDPAPSLGVDEVARQRRKRRATLVGRPVPGSPNLTFGALAEEAQAAASSTEAGADGVEEFLVERGHSRETVAAVLACLELGGSEPAGTAVTAMPVASAGQQRLRTLAQLEAMLHEE